MFSPSSIDTTWLASDSYLAGTANSDAEISCRTETITSFPGAIVYPLIGKLNLYANEPGSRTPNSWASAITSFSTTGLRVTPS